MKHPYPELQAKWDRELRAEETEQNRLEREAGERRARQYRCENLFWRLWGIDQLQALHIAESVWGFKNQHWVGIDYNLVNPWIEIAG